MSIVLDFENQTYVLDKSVPQTLLEGFLLGEHMMFEKFTECHEDNWKVRSIILGSMNNKIQKQYERYKDVWLIRHCMKELYAVPDWKIRYAMMKAFFGARMIEGSSIREHGVMMLSLVEKFKDPQPDFKRKKRKLIMNGLEKSLHELINMLVKYEAMIDESAMSVLVGEASASKAKDNVVGRETTKKDDMSSTAASTLSVPITPLDGVKESRRGFVNQGF
ncbi:UNVERIFIED_CONTAM: hypothetical protein Sangu_3153700 [Sesamum angustifolium]|uniref:Uncharacterized protein n=1 Tax=Sesamum angustifolium TaxID=2727405 RepID=A0AAW2JU93_9LAMI